MIKDESSSAELIKDESSVRLDQDQRFVLDHRARGELGGGGGDAGAGPPRLAARGLTIGIVGLPNVGKSTLFNALTKNDVLAANYPFATIEPNVGVVGVPDPRLDVLAEIFGSAADPAGHRRRSSTSPASSRARPRAQGLGNKFLANIREADAICQVIRVFADADVVHVDGRVSTRPTTSRRSTPS